MKTKLQEKKSQLQTLMELRMEQQQLADWMDKINKAIAEVETDMMSLMSQGVNVSDDSYAVSIKETSRRTPSWKEHFIRVTSKEEAEKVIESTESHVTRHLVISKLGFRVVK